MRHGSRLNSAFTTLALAIIAAISDVQSHRIPTADHLSGNRIESGIRLPAVRVEGLALASENEI
jgi:hypothetical protein